MLPGGKLHLSVPWKVFSGDSSDYLLFAAYVGFGEVFTISQGYKPKACQLMRV